MSSDADEQYASVVDAVTTKRPSLAFFVTLEVSPTSFVETAFNGNDSVAAHGSKAFWRASS